MNEIIRIENIEGDLRVSSREIAEHFEKQHKHVIEKIESIKVENSAVTKMFTESTYVAGTGKAYKEYLISRDGFTLLAMGFTGKKALEWKLKYIEAFNKMEEELRDSNKYQYENISPELKAILMHDKKIQEVQKEVSEVKEDLTEFKEDMPLFTVECEEVTKVIRRIGTQVLGGHGSKAYKDKSLRAKVYADIHRQLKREFDVNSYKAIKRRYLNNALDIVENYSLTIALHEQINMINSQVAFA